MLSIFRFLRGYVRVYLTGFAPERFMNLCNNHQIELWDVVSAGEGYEFYMYANEFLGCKEFLRKTKTKVVLRNKMGLPFLLFRYRKRKVFFLGLIACFAALFLASRFIWAFEISGNRQFTDDMFLKFLDSQQVHYGMAISNLDIDSLEKQLREEYDYITWASAKLEGTKLHISIKENEVGIQEESEELSKGDIRATVSGNVVAMVTRAGVPAVKVGDSVEEGDLLISGIIPIMNDDETLRSYYETRADGEVVIESRMRYTEKLPVTYQKKVYTGNTERIFVLGFGEKEWKLGFLKMEENYEILSVRNPIVLLDNLYLPIIYGYNDYIGYQIIKSSYSKEEASDVLHDRFLRFCTTLEEKGVQIIEKDVKIEYMGNEVVMQGILVIQENAITLCPITEFPEENSIE